MNYNDFRTIYAQQHPASVPTMEVEMSEYPAWLRYAVFLMFLSAAVLSGVHTVPTVHRSIEVGSVAGWVRDGAALLSFVMVELAILLSAYLLVKRSVLAWMVLAVTFTVAMAANLVSVSRAFGESQAVGDQLVAIVLGVAAPLIALMSGKMFVSIHTVERGQHSRAARAFREASQRFDADVLAAWEKYQRRAGVRPSLSESERPQLSAVASADVQPDTSNGQNGHATGQGYTKRTDARTLVESYLAENPDALTMPVRELATLIGVGKSTVATVIAEQRGKGE